MENNSLLPTLKINPLEILDPLCRIGKKINPGFEKLSMYCKEWLFESLQNHKQLTGLNQKIQFVTYAKSLKNV